jgi:hypothetical protein
MRGKTRGLERIDFLVHLHRAELRGKRRPGAPRHDNACHDGRHLAGHTESHEVGDKDLCGKLSQLDRPHKRKDQSHQETDERNNTQRVGTTLLYDQEEVRAAEACLPTQKRNERQQGLTQEGEHSLCFFDRRNRGGECQESSHPLRQARLVRLDLVLRVLGKDLQQEGHKARVPGRNVLGIKGDTLDSRAGCNLLLYLGGRGQLILHLPAPGEPDKQRVVRRTTEAHLALRGGRFCRGIHQRSAFS